MQTFDVRVRLRDRPSTELLRVLRRMFPELAGIPVSELRAHLATDHIFTDLTYVELVDRQAALEPFGVTLELVPEPPAPTAVRITLAGPPTTAQLRALRTRFEALARHPPSTLRNHLTRWPRCVVGAMLSDELEVARRELEQLGVRVEPVGAYDADAVRAVLPAGPECDQAELAIEAVFLPSFDPEVVLRAWTREGQSRLELASVGTQLWRTRYNLPPWLHGKDEQVPAEQPRREAAPFAGDVRAMVDSIHASWPSRPNFGIDGMSVTLRARRGARVVDAEAWSPDPHTDVGRVVAQLRKQALLVLTQPESLARLAELETYLRTPGQQDTR